MLRSVTLGRGNAHSPDGQAFGIAKGDCGPSKEIVSSRQAPPLSPESLIFPSPLSQSTIGKTTTKAYAVPRPVVSRHAVNKPSDACLGILWWGGEASKPLLGPCRSLSGLASR
ncbi:hypothetical protein V8C37DRAFT_387650 [Trichoderma ceciliae]